MSTDDDRIAFLAGEEGEPLSPTEAHDLERLRELLRDPATWAEPDPGLEDRIVAAVAAEAAAGPPIAPDAGGTQVPAARPQRRRRHRLAYALGGAAAAASVAATLVVTTVGGGGGVHQYVAALAPGAAAPGASGTVALSPTPAGWRVELRASGLPRLDNGRYYEAWMVNSAGVRVPIGTFNQGPAVTLWSGVSPKQFATVTVTEQDTSPGGASGGRVLVGHVDIER